MGRLLLLNLTLKNHKIPSWNHIYSTNSYWKRKILVSIIHKEVHDVLLEKGYRYQKTKPYPYKVDIHFIGYFKDYKMALDPDNIPAKLYIDGLKYVVLSNDTLKQIGKVIVESKIDEKNPRLEIYIYKS